jgi:sterol desaturase/sphingolipid hydroxylase (fatty acid hydroxylase superfamily)
LHRRTSGFQDVIKAPIMAAGRDRLVDARNLRKWEVSMTLRNFSLTAAIVFAVIALVQLARAVFGWPVTINAYTVPLWLSWVAFIVAAGLSYFGWKAYAAGT